MISIGSIASVLRKLSSAGALLLLMLLCADASAQGGVSGKSAFNHNATGFVLDSAHVREPCESCHLQAQFRGTPRDCSSCHRAGGRASGKTPSHVPTTVVCDACHLSTTWAPSIFRHRTTQGVSQGSCGSCHNGGFAVGKPARHLITASACDSCHRTTAWLPAAYTHALAAVGSCGACHNGSRATGKPGSHIPTSASCDACHTAGVPFALVSVSVGTMHSSMSGPAATANCATCHSGTYLAQNAQSKPVTHIATSAQCDTCHASRSSWATATYSHLVTDTNCAGCHNGTTALGKPVNHVPSGGQQCDVCHTNNTAFNPARMDHVSTAGQCSSCHNGSFGFANALPKPVNHIPVSTQCDSCHLAGFTAWSPATMNHAGAAGKCSSCHAGAFVSQNAQTKPPTHMATSGQCDTCHSSTSSWATSSLNHAIVTPAVAGRCSTCHNSIAALGKPATHIPTSVQCDTCHTNFSAFRPAQMNHAGLVGQCSGCHNGTYVYANALARPITHIPTSGQCDTCHVVGFVNWSPATMNHAGLTGLCSACHNGSYLAQNAQMKPATHLGTSAQCDSCHQSTTSWATATYSHGVGDTNCSSCHNSITALGKPTNHIPTGAQCSTCHTNSSATFAPAVMSHGGTTGPVAAGNCATCHGGAYLAVNALAKPATHVPTIASCDSCHATAAWTPSTFVHPLAGTCSTCHNGAAATGKPVAHIPTAAACDACHAVGASFLPIAVPVSTMHTRMSGPVATANCSTCHSGAYLAINAQTKPPTHVATTAQCDACHTSTASWAMATFAHGPTATNCAGCHGTTALGKPGTHIPTTAQCSVCHVVGATFLPATMNHAATAGPVAAGNCASCHNGGYTAVNALAKPVRHLPTTLTCDACHIGTVVWTSITAAFSHSGVIAGTCQTCHGGSYSGVPAKSIAHIPTAADCSICHKNNTAFTPATMNHAATTGPLAAGNCTSCHNGAYTAVNALPKPISHIPTTAQCSLCHGNYTSFKPATTNHAATTGPVAVGNCSTCHGGAYTAVNAQAKPVAGHIPTSAQCDACHHSYTLWLPTTFNHAGVAPGTCASCHVAPYANIKIKPSNHIPTTTPAGMPGNECSLCHSSTTTFLTERMNHGTMQTLCAVCHNSTSAYLGTMDKKSSSHEGRGTKDCSVSGCHRPLGSRGTPYTRW